MLVSKIINYKTINNMFFIILFPFFFIYSVLLAYDLSIYIPGYFSLFSIILIFLVLIKYTIFTENQEIKLYFIEIIFIVLMMYIFFIGVINYYLNTFHEYSLSLLIYSLQGVIFNLTCYFLGKEIQLKNIFFKKLYLFLFFTCTLLVLINLNDLGMFYLKLDSENSELLSTYQSFARTLVIMSFFSFALTFKTSLNNIVIIVALISLFFNSARTEFVLFGLSIFLYLIIFDFKQTFIKMIIVLFLVVIGFYSNPELWNIVYDSRLWDLISNTEYSTSLTARLETIIFALESIKSNFFIGSYASYIDTLGLGLYAHNILSAWADLGLLGFFLYIIIIVYAIIKLFLYKEYYLKVEYILFFIMFIFYVLAIITSKDYTFMFLGFLVAFSVSLDKIILKENNAK
jgi:hypothetical protein